MKKRSLYLIPIFILYCVFIHAPDTLATVSWTGAPFSVTDDDISISGPTLQTFSLGHTYVNAFTKDITIDIDNISTLEGNPTGQSILHFNTKNNHTITVNVNHTTTTEGSESSVNDHLLILFHGDGKFIFNIKGDKNLIFGQNQLSQSGTRAYIVLQRQDEYNQGPTVLFKRQNSSRANKDELITIIIDDNSILGYLANANVGDNTLYGSYVFDCSTTSTKNSGLVELNIKNNGAFLVWPQRIYTDPDSLTLADIHPSRLAGGQAALRTINGLGPVATHAGLWITNQNNTFHHLRYDPFLKLDVRNASNNANPEDDYVGSFLTEKQKGLVIGSNGILDIYDGTYIVNVGLTNNINPNVSHIPGWKDKDGNWIPASRIIKSRNPSALFFDQSLNPWATKPTVRFGNQTALLAGSGVDIKDNFRSIRQPHSFMVDPANRTNNSVILDQPYTNFVIDVEGDAEFIGTDRANAKIELLSLEVNPAGGYAVTAGATTQLPSRSFKRYEDGSYYTFNKGSFLINGRMNLYDMTLTHTDELSFIGSRDDVSSEPVYIGGETYSVLRGPVPYDLNGPANDPNLRPKITFTSSDFKLITSAATTGVDLLVPNKVVGGGVCIQNIANFIFGYNGIETDQGQGQTLLLGTARSSYAFDGISPISADAHLDVIQTLDCFDLPTDQAPYDYDEITQTYTNVPYDHALIFNVAPNDSSVIERLPGNISDQLTTQTVYLGQNSNISIGTNEDATDFFADTHPWLRIFGDFFTFESSGGASGDVRIGGKTGQGAIFVDLNGRLSVNSLIDCSFGCMVVRSRNAEVKLPFQNAHFDESVAVSDWNITFDNPDCLISKFPAQDEYSPVDPTCPIDKELHSEVILKADEWFQVYRIDWSTVRQGPTTAPLVKTNDIHLHKQCCLNLRKKDGSSRLTLPNNIPTIEGHVEQLQITGSLIGDIIHIRVRGPKAYIGEVNFPNTREDGEIPSIVFILEEGGTVGIGSAELNTDSSRASVTLGRSGIIIIANNGGGEVILNSDVEIEGHAPFYFGPDAAPGTVLKISGEEGVTLYMDYKSTLDLRPLSTTNLDTEYPPIVQIDRNKQKSIITGGHIVEFADGLQVNVQPGARIVFSDGALGLPSGILRFADNAFLNFVEYKPMDDQFNAIPLGSIDNSLSPSTPTDAAEPHNQYAPLTNYGNGLLNTNNFRTRIIGNGVLQFRDNSYAYLPYSAIVGIETLNEVVDPETQTTAEIKQTNITIQLKDSGKFYIGEQNFVEGGILQVGNVRDNGADHSISFTLNLDGKDALFTVGALGVVGFNVGVAQPNISKITDLLVDTLYNVSDISIEMDDGDFEMSRIYDTNSQFSSILLIGDNGNNTPTYNLDYLEIGANIDTIAERRVADSLLRGGSNIAYIKKGTVTETINNAGLISPIVLDQDNLVQIGVDQLNLPIYHARLRAGILASTELQALTENGFNLTALGYFNQLKTQDALSATPSRNRANAGTPGVEQLNETILVNTVSGTTILRDEFADIFSNTDSETARKNAVEYGAVFADIGSVSGNINALIEIPV